MTQSNERYFLEILEPGSTRECWVAFSSNSPFMSIHVGEILDPQIWNPAPDPGVILQVVNVEHVIWQLDGQDARHKIVVYTKAVEDSTETRLSQQD